jgi:hypothetical protein
MVPDQCTAARRIGIGKTVRSIKSTCFGAIHVRAQIPPALTGDAR